MPFYDENIPKLNSVVFLGRLHNEHKGCDMLLRTWKKIEDCFSNWKLIVCGDGPDRDNLLNYSKHLQLQHAEFQGFTPPHLASAILQKSKIFCLTSRVEGFPIAVIEAERSGCVPIAYNSYPAAQELIEDGKNGAVFKYGDESGFVDAFKRVPHRSGESLLPVELKDFISVLVGNSR
jgi:glycosyltransferase involved in cell wall biosynthesis